MIEWNFTTNRRSPISETLLLLNALSVKRLGLKRPLSLPLWQAWFIDRYLNTFLLLSTMIVSYGLHVRIVLAGMPASLGWSSSRLDISTGSHCGACITGPHRKTEHFDNFININPLSSHLFCHYTRFGLVKKGMSIYGKCKANRVGSLQYSYLIRI